MGFVAGVTGGVTLTLGLTYLALRAHERNRESQSDLLRGQTRVVNSLVPDPLAPRKSPHNPNDALYPPSRAELALRERGHFIETAKDRWNAEIEGAVRWAQTRDWQGVRENAEERLLGIARSVDVNEVREKVQGTAKGVAGQVREDVKAVVEKGREAVEKGREAVGRAKAAVKLAEERAETKVDAKLLHLSEVDKALAQRYEKDDGVMKKSVKEVLAERYTPIDKRDNTKLRGI
ncbi:hypothetical protein OQA88_11268 [Cercophora sp. LCS_1]